MINVALLGSGLFASNAYLPSLVTNKSSTNLHTIWSRSSKSSSGLVEEAHKLGLSPIGKHGDEGMESVLSDPEIDAVMLVLPISVQPDIVRKALKAGKHVLSEKPLAKDVQGAKELIEEYEKEYKSKGSIWRVAENFAHEPLFHYAKELLSTPNLGPVLFYQLRNEATVIDGQSWHATTWRTIPDYQGGFLLDGGVHFAAQLRLILPTRPHTVISQATLHRQHLLPHDTVVALTTSAPSTTVPPHGKPTTLKTPQGIEVVPTDLGKSNIHGSILLSFATPDLTPQGKQVNGLYITCLNGTLNITSAPGQIFKVTLTGAKDSGVKDVEKEGKGSGVEVEIRMFSKAVEEVKEGKVASEENFGEPRDAMWDLAFVQACLTSAGKEVVVDELIAGK